MIGEGPKYSFGIPDDKKGNINDKYKSLKIEIPGPGSYDIEDKDKGPSYSFGLREKTQRRVPDKSSYPPIGIYEIRKDSDFNVPCTIFSKEPKSKKKKISKQLILNPNYDILTTRTSKWSFGEGYNITGNKENNNKDKKINNKLRNSTPSPSNSYIQTFFGKEGYSYTFSKEKYNHDDDFDVAQRKKKNGPEPGKYNQVNYIPDTPSYSIGIKVLDLNSKKKSEYPPPGKYVPKYHYLSLNKTLPSWSFGSKEGPILNKKENKDKNIDNSRNTKKVEIPGPGSYNYTNDKIPQGPKYTIGEVRKEKKKEEFPGPGKYNVKLYSSGNLFTFGVKGEDEHIKQVLKDNYPGPGTYDVKDVIYVKNATINPISNDGKKKGDVPGPGSYKIPTSFDYISSSTRSTGSWNPNYRYV